MTPRRAFTAYFYPRSPCGERRGRQTPWTYQDDFYPRSPCGERQERKALIADVYIFLSTLSLRRATALEKALQGLHWQFLSTLSLRRATDNLKRNIMQMAISIHALLAESDFRNLH